MARKSRKKPDAGTPQTGTPPTFLLGAYVRMSAVDRKHKGNSIENQQAIIAAYAAERSDLELVETYIEIITTRLIQFNYSPFAEFAVCILPLLCAFLHTPRKPCKQAVFVQS